MMMPSSVLPDEPNWEQPKALAEPEKIEVQHVKMKPEAPKAKKKGNNKKVGKIGGRSRSMCGSCSGGS